MTVQIRNAVVAIASIFVFSSFASADVCRSPTVRVHNKTDETLKVTKIKYFDDCDNKWRTENVPETSIPPQGDHEFEDDLEYVNGCAIPEFQIYHMHLESYFWGPEVTPAQGSSQSCGTGVQYDVDLH